MKDMRDWLPSSNIIDLRGVAETLMDKIMNIFETMMTYSIPIAIWGVGFSLSFFLICHGFRALGWYRHKK